MLAAYLYGPRDLRLVERDPLPLRPQDVRVEVAYSGICGTELHLYGGMVFGAPATEPQPLGHEFSGRVVEVGAAVTSLRLGDPEVQIAFDRAKLASMDLDPGEASRLVRNAVQGEAATQFNDPERKIDVRVRASEDERSLVAGLDLLQVGRNDGEPVRLGSVAQSKWTNSLPQRTALADHLRQFPAEPFDGTPEAETYWNALASRVVDLAVALSGPAVDVPTQRLVSVLWASAQLALAAGRRVVRADVALRVIGLPPRW